METGFVLFLASFAFTESTISFAAFAIKPTRVKILHTPVLLRVGWLTTSVVFLGIGLALASSYAFSQVGASISALAGGTDFVLFIAFSLAISIALVEVTWSLRVINFTRQLLDRSVVDSKAQLSVDLVEKARTKEDAGNEQV